MHSRPRTVIVLTLSAVATIAVAQGGAEPSSTVWSLFVKSFDLFSVILILGSLAAVTQITRVVMDTRESNIAPPESTTRLKKILAASPTVAALQGTLKDDETFVPRVLGAALEQSDRGRDAMREAAEIEASLIAAKWFRKIEILNVIGNLGPLVGLAGTVWGMIIAFNTLGEAGGEAGPAQLSSGIAKALFHTLLGLMLAIPCLLTFGLYRGLIDRVCNRAMADAAAMLERLPTGSSSPGKKS